jgi:hypothetical protein
MTHFTLEQDNNSLLLSAGSYISILLFVVAVQAKKEEPGNHST